jgi:hypothetical protein
MESQLSRHPRDPTGPWLRGVASFIGTWRNPSSGTVISAPYRFAISSGSGGSIWWPHLRHHTINRTLAAAAFPRVIGGPVYLIRAAVA